MSAFFEKRVSFQHSKSQRFTSNRGLLGAKVSEKGGSFYTWRTVMGYHLFTRVEGAGLYPTIADYFYL